jgi:hypothetical protein
MPPPPAIFDLGPKHTTTLSPTSEHAVIILFLKP